MMIAMNITTTTITIIIIIIIININSIIINITINITITSIISIIISVDRYGIIKYIDLASSDRYDSPSTPVDKRTLRCFDSATKGNSVPVI